MPFSIQLSFFDSSSSLIDAVKSRILPRDLEAMQPLKAISRSAISEFIVMGIDAERPEVLNQPIILLDIVDPLSFPKLTDGNKSKDDNEVLTVEPDIKSQDSNNVIIEFIWPFDLNINSLTKVQRSLSELTNCSIYNRISASNREITKSNALILAPIVSPRSVNGGVIYLKSSLSSENEVDVPYHLVPKAESAKRQVATEIRSTYSELSWNFDHKSHRPKEELMLWTDVARRSLIKMSSNFDQGKFFGKSLDGSIAQGHRHAHFVADFDDDKKIKSILLYAPENIPQAIIESATKITRLNTTIPGRGSVSAKISSILLENSKVSSNASEKAKYRSTTPYIPIRHRHKNQTNEDFLLNDLRSELSERGISSPPRNLRVLGNFTDERYLLRAKEGRGGEVSGWRIEFNLDSGIGERLSLGRFSHFGMGLFKALG